jgi:hypothetical protein
VGKYGWQQEQKKAKVAPDLSAQQFNLQSLPMYPIATYQGNNWRSTWQRCQIGGAAINAFVLGATWLQLVINQIPGMQEVSVLPLVLLMLTLISAQWALWQAKEIRSANLFTQEQNILRYAQEQNGRPLTVSEISLYCSLPVKDAVQTLNKLSGLGACSGHVTEEGEMLFCFSSFRNTFLEFDQPEQ